MWTNVWLSFDYPAAEIDSSFDKAIHSFEAQDKWRYLMINGKQTLAGTAPRMTI
ncbi:MAG: hypothetical protein H0V82_08260 [Candidatus Protochlamydia sp.]|nr:hypothetical protein [Candidatus Protochlamydia sp.]